jgi:hypothetical protein
MAASKSSTASKVAQGLKSLVRVGMGYGFSDIKNVEPSTVTDFNKPRSIWQEADIMLPLSVHLAIRETWDDSANVDFYGHGIKPAEIYMTAVQLGAKFTLPMWAIQPWAGAGVTGGFVAMSDPTNRNTHDWRVAFDKITKAVRGVYWQAGLDIVTPVLSLRAGVMNEKIETDRFSNLNSTALEFNHSMVMVGLVSSVN